MNPKSNTYYCPRILLQTLSYILYRINIVFGIIFFSLLDNVKAASTSKKKGNIYCGVGAKHYFLLQLGGKQRKWVGNRPPSLYVKRGPGRVNASLKAGPKISVDLTHFVELYTNIVDLWLLKVLICFRSICWKNAFIKDQMIFSLSKISSIMCLVMCPAIASNSAGFLETCDFSCHRPSHYNLFVYLHCEASRTIDYGLALHVSSLASQ